MAPGKADPGWSETSGSCAPSPQAEPSGRDQERLVDPKNAATPLAARQMHRFHDSQIAGSQTEESQTDDEYRQGDTQASPNPQRTAADEITETFDVHQQKIKSVSGVSGVSGVSSVPGVSGSSVCLRCLR